MFMSGPRIERAADAAHIRIMTSVKPVAHSGVWLGNKILNDDFLQMPVTEMGVVQRKQEAMISSFVSGKISMPDVNGTFRRPLPRSYRAEAESRFVGRSVVGFPACPAGLKCFPA